MYLFNIPTSRTRLPILASTSGYTVQLGEGKRTRELDGIPYQAAPVSADRKVLVHNLVKSRHGSRGFRAWLDDPDEKIYEVCTCGWAPRLVHYRVRITPPEALKPIRR